MLALAALTALVMLALAALAALITAAFALWVIKSRDAAAKPNPLKRKGRHPT